MLTHRPVYVEKNQPGDQYSAAASTQNVFTFVLFANIPYSDERS